MADLTKKIKAKYEKKDPRLARKIGLGNDLKALRNDEDFVVMPEWWQQATNTKGIPFGRAVVLAGTTDSGKTSAAIEAMRCAQAQDCKIIYVETEGKTTPKDFEIWGVNPDEVFVVQSTIAEEAFELMFEAWDAVAEAYPDNNLLVIVDSIGNMISLRDSDLDLTDDKQKPGGKGQVNRLAMSKMINKREATNAAVLLISYTYANIGSPGRKTAGGDAISLFGSLIYQTTRIGWAFKTVKGEKYRVGAKVGWTLQKNHIDKDNPGPYKIVLEISGGQITYKGEKKND
jgi:RecA/RadA recombinase